MQPDHVTDIIEIEQLLARGAVGMTGGDVESVTEVFTADGTSSAFGDTSEHALRIGCRSDTSRRTSSGGKLATGSMAVRRGCGSRHSGRAHDPTRPQPTKR